MSAPGARTTGPVVVVGSINRDYVSFVPHLPVPGETVLAERVLVGTGGKGSNQAVAIARMGVDVDLVGCVGEDEDGRAVLSDLASSGVGLGHIVTTPRATGRALVTVDAQGGNSIVVAPGANHDVTPVLATGALRAASVTSRLVVLQAEVPVETIEAALAVAAENNMRAVVNLAPFAPLSADALASCDPLVVNESEAAALAGRDVGGLDQAVEVAVALSRRCRSVVVTLGDEGAVVAECGRVEHVPALPVEVVDTTGAGDALVGGLAAGLASGASLIEALRWGVCAGSLSVAAPGAQASYPDAAAVTAASAQLTS